MPVLVSDTSVVVDLDRGGLLEEVFRLPDEFAVPDLLFERELAGILGDRLLDLGLRVEPLDGAEVTAAATLLRSQPALSGPDAFAFAIAQARAWTLLTGDAALRLAGEQAGLEIHGVLWVLDRLEVELPLGGADLHRALTAITSHPRCRLPKAEVGRRLARYQP